MGLSHLPVPTRLSVEKRKLGVSIHVDYKSIAVSVPHGLHPPWCYMLQRKRDRMLPTWVCCINMIAGTTIYMYLVGSDVASQKYSQWE